jgi:hypothetical protein
MNLHHSVVLMHQNPRKTQFRGFVKDEAKQMAGISPSGGLQAPYDMREQ